MLSCESPSDGYFLSKVRLDVSTTTGNIKKTYIIIHVYADASKSSWLGTVKSGELSCGIWSSDWTEATMPNDYYPYVKTIEVNPTSVNMGADGEVSTQLTLTGIDQYGVEWVNAPTNVTATSSKSVSPVNSKTPTVTYASELSDYTSTVQATYTDNSSYDSNPSATINLRAPRTMTFDNAFNMREWRRQGISGSNATVSDISDNGFTVTSSAETGKEGTSDFSYDFYLKPNTTYYFTADTEFTPGEGATSGYDVYIHMRDIEKNNLALDSASVIISGCHVEGGTYISDTGKQAADKSVCFVFTTPANMGYARIRFDANNNGSVLKVSNICISEYNDVTYSAGQEMFAAYDKAFKDYNGSISVPSRTGYRFQGYNWVAHADGVANDLLCYDGAGNWVAEGLADFNLADYSGSYGYVVPFVSQWLENEYYIGFDSNKGSGTMSSVDAVKYTADVTLPGNTFTKTGHTFKGWNTAADGSGTAIADGATVSKLVAEHGKWITLYAQWDVNNYTVTFRDTTTEGGPVVSEKQYPYGTPASSIEIPTLEKTPVAEGHYKTVVDGTIGTVESDATYYLDVELEAHTPGTPVKENEVGSTCSKAGSYDMVTRCTVCNYEVSRVTHTVDKLPHTPNIEAADCETDKICTVCKEVLQAKLGHSYDSVVTKPTCTTGGYTTHTCSKCGHSYTDANVSELGHSYGDWEVIREATCIAKGSHKKVCSVCGDTVTEDIEINPDAHKWGAWTHLDGTTHQRVCEYNDTHKENGECTSFTTTKDATCTEAGNQKCNDCGYEFVGSIDATGHDFNEVVAAKDPTCMETGNDAYKTCKNCSMYFETDAAEDSTDAKTEAAFTIAKDEKNGHAWGEPVVTPPTCTEQGKTVKTCTLCGEKNTTYQDANGHTFDEIVDETDLTKNRKSEATCTEKAVYYKSCSVCGTQGEDTFEYGEVLGHNYEATVTPPTCTSTGYTTHTCSRCGDTYKDSTTDMLEHTLGEYIVDTEATCTTPGSQHKECIYCDHKTDTEEIPAKGHVFGETTAANDATCTETGNEAYKFCDNCDRYFAADADAYSTAGVVDTTSFVIDATNHANKEDKVQQDATCLEGGYTAGVWCPDCKTWISGHEEIPAIAHKNKVYHKAVDATCSKEGTIEYWACPDCSKNFSDEACTVEATNLKTEINPANHVNTEDSEAVKETCLEVGYTAGVYCKDCKTYISGHETIPAIAHANKEHHEQVDATCVATGIIEYWSCPDCGKNFSDEACQTVVTDLTIEIATDAHDLKTTAAKAPTCTEIGWDEYVTCQREGCGYTTYVEKPATNHANKVHYEMVDSTCMAKGTIEYWSCPDCDKNFSDEACTTVVTDLSIAMKDHDYSGEYKFDLATKTHTQLCINGCNAYNPTSTECTFTEEITLEPTCTEKGTKKFTCTDCEGTYTVDIVARGHIDEDNNGYCDRPDCGIRICDHIGTGRELRGDYEATCTTDGYSGDLHCDLCDEIVEYGEKIGALGHDYTVFVKTVPFTCTTKGYDVYKCVRCDVTENRNYTDAAHTAETEYIQTVAPTCSAVGEEKLYCEYCDAVLDTREVAIVATAHKAETDYTVMQKATCEADGYKAILCEYCNAELSTAPIAKREHVYADNGVQTAATCVDTGVMNTICTNTETDTHAACAHTSTRVIEIDPDAHKAEDNYTVMQKATCEADGYKAILCEYCDAELKTEAIAKREHVYKDNGVQTAATCI
ncbi:MAG: InlB B-repeat-containing protein, partial [Clostridia bacterium]|nr:InlB B-repeat-containing protein [Clostridia bacterium]